MLSYIQYFYDYLLRKNHFIYKLSVIIIMPTILTSIVIYLKGTKIKKPTDNKKNT